MVRLATLWRWLRGALDRLPDSGPQPAETKGWGGSPIDKVKMRETLEADTELAQLTAQGRKDFEEGRYGRNK